jgi:hypothetical protein
MSPIAEWARSNDLAALFSILQFLTIARSSRLTALVIASLFAGLSGLHEQHPTSLPEHSGLSESVLQIIFSHAVIFCLLF